MSARKKPKVESLETRQKIVEDMMNIIAKGEKPDTPEQQLVERAKQASVAVCNRFMERTKLDYKLLFDKPRALHTMCELHIEEFRGWDKEQLLFLVSMLLTEIAMERI